MAYNVQIPKNAKQIETYHNQVFEREDGIKIENAIIRKYELRDEDGELYNEFYIADHTGDLYYADYVKGSSEWVEAS